MCDMWYCLWNGCVCVICGTVCGMAMCLCVCVKCGTVCGMAVCA